MYIAVICSPFPTHLAEFADVLASMSRAGHRVELWGDGNLEPVCSRAGLGLHPVELSHEYGMADCIRAADYYTKVFFPLAREQVTPIVSLCRQHVPDVLVSHVRVYSAVLASEITGIPVVSYSFNGSSFGHSPEALYGLPNDRLSANPRRRHLWLAMSKAFYQEMDQRFTDTVTGPLGLRPRQNAISMASRTCVLVFSIPLLAGARNASSPHVKFVGPLMKRMDASPAVPDWPRDRTCCYLTIGTQQKGRDSGGDADARLCQLLESIPGSHLVLVGLGGKSLTVRRSLSPNVVFMNYAPQVECIRRSDYVICHGGSKTVHEALFHGKPVLIVPAQEEQMELAKLVAAAGAGLVAPAGAGPEKLRPLLETLLKEERFRLRASQVGSQLQREASEGQHERIVQIFEDVVRQGSARAADI